MIRDSQHPPAATAPLFDRGLKGDRDYWLARLAPPPELGGPGLDRPLAGGAPMRAAAVRLELPSPIEAALQRLTGGSPFLACAALVAALEVCLYRLSGRRRVSVGTPALRGADGRRMAANAVTILGEIAPELTFRELLLQIREALLAAYARQGYPFVRLVADLGLESSDGRCPLFDVALVMADLHTELPDVGHSLTVHLSRQDGRLRGCLECRPGRLRAVDLERFAGHFQHVLRTGLESHGAPIGGLGLLGEAERHQVVRELNDTGRDHGRPDRLHRLVEAQVERAPDAVAVVAEDRSLTYRELDLRANRLARHLRRLGVGPDVAVCVFLERSLELLVGLLGILKAGGVYVPVDPGYPRERVELMLVDSGAPVLLTLAGLAGGLPPSRATMVLLDRLETPAAGGGERCDGGAAADDLAYVIYTSGSTGRPKGAMSSHRAIANHLLWMLGEYGLAADDRVLQKTPTSFDVSVWELCLPLLAGARLVMARPGGHRDSAYLAETVRGEQITTLHFVPSMLRLFLEEESLASCTSLRRVFAGGEALPLDLADRFLADCRAELHNLYGPAEAAIDVTHWRCTRRDAAHGTVPIGRAIANLAIHLLDGDLCPVPVGMAGDLYIGGVGLARGYHRRPDLTAGRFVPNPLGREPGARLYRTGDRARLAADGAIEFLGRVDDQVKIRGFRVELGEIEASIRSHPAVREAAAAVREARPGDLRLVAYAILRPGAALSPADLRDFLAAKLPEPLVPSAFVWLAAFPLGPSGKLDRGALPDPAGADHGASGRVPPRGPTERAVAFVWERVLGQGEVGADNDFFALGGHSLLATQVAARLRLLFRVELPVVRLFEKRTVAALAAEIASLRGSTEVCDEIARLFLHARDLPDPPDAGAAEAGTQAAAGAAWTDLVPPARFALFERLLAERGLDVEFAGDLPRRGGHGPFPLSLNQEQLWYVDRVEGGSATYNLQTAMRLAGPLDPATLARSVDEIARRHESLRTTFRVIGGSPLQLASPLAKTPLAAIDLSALPAAARDREVQRLAIGEARRPFDLEADRLVRLTLLRLAVEEHVAVLAMHHIVADGWSMGIFVHELSALYGAFSQGLASPLPELRVQYRDFVAWQREHLQGDLLAAELAYWRRRLAGAPARLRLPTDRPRPAVQTTRGAVLPFTVAPPLAAALRALAREEEVTLFMALLAGFKVLLRHYTGQDDLVVGTHVANRRHREAEGLIGFFVNTLVLRTDLGGDPTCRELLARVRETTLGAYTHQDLPFAKLVEALSPERERSHNPLFQVVFSLDNFPRPGAAGVGLTLEAVPFHGGAAKFDLSLELREVSEGLEGLLTFNVDLFAPTTAARVLAHYSAVLQQMAAAPDCPLSRLSLSGGSETDGVAADFNSDLEELA